MNQGISTVKAGRMNTFLFINKNYEVQGILSIQEGLCKASPNSEAFYFLPPAQRSLTVCGYPLTKFAFQANPLFLHLLKFYQAV